MLRAIYLSKTPLDWTLFTLWKCYTNHFSLHCIKVRLRGNRKQQIRFQRLKVKFYCLYLHSKGWPTTLSSPKWKNRFYLEPSKKMPYTSSMDNCPHKSNNCRFQRLLRSFKKKITIIRARFYKSWFRNKILVVVADGQTPFLVIADCPKPRKKNPDQSRLFWTEVQAGWGHIVSSNPSFFFEGLKPPLPEHLRKKRGQSPALPREGPGRILRVPKHTHHTLPSCSRPMFGPGPLIRFWKMESGQKASDSDPRHPHGGLQGPRGGLQPPRCGVKTPVWEIEKTSPLLK